MKNHRKTVRTAGLRNAARFEYSNRLRKRLKKLDKLRKVIVAQAGEK